MLASALSLWRETLYKTLETVFCQKINLNYEIVIILQWLIDTKKIDSLNVNNIPVRIFNFNRGLWFGFYRNKAVEFALWNILAWIDDDEWTMDDKWLYKITRPIIVGQYQVVTAGYYIKLGQWYITDCISLLWWPGGGALGFEKMWHVMSDNTTNHICTGNFAILRSLIQNIPFPANAVYGGEDNALSKNLVSSQISINYNKSCTVYHEPRKFAQALSWWQTRIANSRHAKTFGFYEENLYKKWFRFFKNLFTMDKYIVGKIFCCLFILYYYFFSKERN